MKAISIKQPWAWLIVNGHKDIENRSWQTKYRGRVLIHTGQKPDTEEAFQKAEEILCKPIPRDLPLGSIVGEANISACVHLSESPWFFGEYGFVLKDAKEYNTPTPCKGQLGFFTPQL